MQNTNYCAEILDLPPKVVEEIQRRFLSYPYKQIIESAVKFRLPDNGAIFSIKPGPLVDIIKNYCPKFRLPYPCIAIEYFSGKDRLVADNQINYDASVVLATEHVEGEQVYVYLYAFNRLVMSSGLKCWCPNVYSVMIYTHNGIPVITPMRMVEGDDFGGTAQLNIGEEISALVQLVAALSCENSIAVDGETPSTSLNKKRIAAGKTPFFTYKTLAIKPMQTKKMGCANGHHSSPRIHLRRGHIRRLEDKTIWVNAAVVGNKCKGAIHKDYSVALAG
jgi:hypothetical protein